MNLEDLNLVWKSQDREPIYMINRASVHALVKRKGRNIDRVTNLFEKLMIGVTFSLGVILPVDAWRDGDGPHHYIAGALCIAVAGFARQWRIQRLQHELRYDDSMLGIIERALSQIDYQMHRLKTYLWWFHIPVAITSGIGLAIYGSTPITLIWAAVVALCGLSCWGTHRDIRKFLQPKRRELASLRDKLTELEPA